MKLVFTIPLILFSCLVQAASLPINDIIEVLLEKNIIVRDSGQEVTKDFLYGCIKQQNPARYKLECDDVLFTHYISSFQRSDDNSMIILITQDGASVENRWVFAIRVSEYIDIKNQVWPNITDAMISNLLIQQTGNKKYTSNYVRSVAHSSYRVLHTRSNVLIVRSGIPDESYGTELGVIEWDGRKFNFVPKRS